MADAALDLSALGFTPADTNPPAPVSGGGFQTVAPRYVQPNEPGYTPGAMTTTTLSPADLVRFNAGQGPDPSAKTPDLDLTQHGFSPANDSDPPPGGMPAPAVHDVGIGSRISNIAAGGNEALAGALGAPVDLMAGGLNLASRGINAVAGTHIPAIVDPVGGSDSFKHAFGVVGANPDDVTAQDGLDKVLRAGAAGVVSAAIPAGGAAAAVRAGLASAPAAAAAVDALGNFTLPNATLGAVAGVSGDQAAQLVPDEYKPIANVVGGLVGGGGAALLGGGVNSLARLAEPMNSAKPNALLDLAGKPLADSSGRPLNATPGQVQTAGRIIDANSADPAAVRSALANGDPTLVPGSNPTTFQVTRDPMLGQAERGLSRDGGAGSAAFMGNADVANDARVAAIRSIAPDADVSALPQAAQAQAAALDASGQARIQALQAQATQAAQGLGGDLPAGSEGQLGQTLRAPIDAANQAARAREGQLWNAIDPDGTLAVDMTPVQQRARSIMQGVGPLAEPMTDKEAAIMQSAAGAPGVVPFRGLADLRSRLTTAIKTARTEPDQAQTVRRLSMLLDGVHDTMAGAANGADLAPAAAADGVASTPGFGTSATFPAPSTPVAAPNVGGEVFTPSGQRVGVNYELADAGNLVTSHDQDMQPNPAFPQELQPRQRDRAASQAQVAKIAGQLQPERLGASSTVADGAPIVGPDNIVESGNGRVLAIRRAYAANGPQAQGYRDWLAGQGHDTTGMAEPVLIRRRTTEMTPQQRVAFTGEGSTPTTLAMSATERAAGDAKRLSGDVLGKVQPGDVTDPANRDFTRGFLRHVVEPGQEGAFVSADGGLSREGAARVRAALVHKAYGDQGLSAALAETTDPTARVLAGAMQDAAGPMARLRAGIEGGTVDPKVDIAPALVEATNVVQQARQRGISLADAVAQRDAFSQVSPHAERVLQAAYGPNLQGRMSADRMTDLLNAYARHAEEQSTAGSLFGGNLTAEQLLDGVSAKYGKAAGTDGQSAYASPVGQGDGGRGGEARGIGLGAGGETAPGAGSGQGGGPRILPEAPALTANFDQAAADRYAAARQATADRASTFKNAPGVGEVLRGGPRSGTFRTADSDVPATLLEAGAKGSDVINAYMAAGGTPEAVSHLAAFALRQNAMRADGTIDPAKFAVWSHRYASALSAVPEVRERFNTAASAQDAVEATMGQHAEAVRALQATAAGKFLGNADPVAQVNSILRGRTAQADMADLAAVTANNPDARAGLQRAVAELILRDMKTDQATVTGGETQLRSAQLQAFIRKSSPALREIMTDRQVNTLQAVVDDLQRSSLSVSGTKIPGGSDTIQNKGATVTLGRALMAESKNSMVAGGAGAGAMLGMILGGPAAGALGGAAGGATALAGRAVGAARAAGMKTVDDLVREAMLRPEVAQVLLQRVTPASKGKLAKSLVAALARGAPVAPIDSKGKRQAPPLVMAGPPANALLRPSFGQLPVAGQRPAFGQIPEARRNALMR